VTALDELLERQIEDAYQCLVKAKTPEGRQAAFNAMRALCRQRTADRVLAMEQSKGIAHP